MAPRAVKKELPDGLRRTVAGATLPRLAVMTAPLPAQPAQPPPAHLRRTRLGASRAASDGPQCGPGSRVPTQPAAPPPARLRHGCPSIALAEPPASTPPQRAAGRVTWDTQTLEAADDDCLGDALRAALQGGPPTPAAPPCKAERILRKCGPRLRRKAQKIRWVTEPGHVEGEEVVISSGDEAPASSWFSHLKAERLEDATPTPAEEHKTAEEEEEDAVRKAVAHATSRCGGPPRCAWCALEILAKSTKQACNEHRADVRDHPCHVDSAASSSGAAAGTGAASAIVLTAVAGQIASAPIVGPMDRIECGASGVGKPAFPPPAPIVRARPAPPGPPTQNAAKAAPKPSTAAQPRQAGLPALIYGASRPQTPYTAWPSEGPPSPPAEPTRSPPLPPTDAELPSSSSPTSAELDAEGLRLPKAATWGCAAPLPSARAAGGVKISPSSASPGGVCLRPASRERLPPRRPRAPSADTHQRRPRSRGRSPPSPATRRTRRPSPSPSASSATSLRRRRARTRATSDADWPARKRAQRVKAGSPVREARAGSHRSGSRQRRGIRRSHQRRGGRSQRPCGTVAGPDRDHSTGPAARGGVRFCGSGIRPCRPMPRCLPSRPCGGNTGTSRRRHRDHGGPRLRRHQRE